MSDSEDIDGVPEEVWDRVGIDPEWLKKEIEDLHEREKESTGVDPAFAQRLRAEMFSERLLSLYGIYLSPLDVMEVLMWTGVKLALDSLGHVKMGKNSLTYTSEEDGTVDLTKYKVKRRIEK
jgi:hypothetical protein